MMEMQQYNLIVDFILNWMNKFKDSIRIFKKAQK